MGWFTRLFCKKDDEPTSSEDYVGCSDEQIDLRNKFYHFVSAYKDYHAWISGGMTVQPPELTISEMMDDLLSSNEAWINSSPIVVTHSFNGTNIVNVIRDGSNPLRAPRTLDECLLHGVVIKVQRNG